MNVHTGTTRHLISAIKIKEVSDYDWLQAAWLYNNLHSLNQNPKASKRQEMESRHLTPTTNIEGFGESERPSSLWKNLHSAFKLPATPSTSAYETL